MSVSMKLTNEAFRLKLEYAACEPEKLGTLVAARRDSAAFQVIVNADSGYSLTKGLNDWYSAKRRVYGPFTRLRLAVESPFPVKMDLEEFVTDDDLIEKADILLGCETRESAPNTPSAMWVELEVPADAKPGDYEIKVTLFASDYNSDERVVATETVRLKVYDVLLPEARDVSFYLDLWQHNSNIARKHDVPLWSDEHFAVIEKYVSAISELGQKSITVVASEIPWAGQGCYVEHKYGGDLYEYSCISITKELDGSFSYDFSKMQRYIDLCTSYGISGDIEVIGLVNIWDQKPMGAAKLIEDYPEMIRLRYFDKTDACFKYVRRTEEFFDYVKALERYFITTGQIERVRIAADEPADMEKYRKSITGILSVAPSFRLKTAINHVEFIEEFGDNIDDFAPYIRCASEEYDRLISYKRENAGKKFLWYVCCFGANPNTYVRSPLIESRIIGILTDAMRFDGFLRWNFTVWPDDPRKDIRYGGFEAGDTNFVYPAYNGAPLLSLRYKNLRRGIFDFEIIQMVRKHCGSEVAESLVEKVIFVRDMNKYYELMKEGKSPIFSTEWNTLNSFKEEMLSLLEGK